MYDTLVILNLQLRFGSLINKLSMSGHKLIPFGQWKTKIFLQAPPWLELGRQNTRTGILGIILKATSMFYIY